jgi:hypothetical protein
MYAFVTFLEEEATLEVLHRPHFFVGVRSTNEMVVCRAKYKQREKQYEPLNEDVRKIFVGGIPNQVELGGVTRGV